MHWIVKFLLDKISPNLRALVLKLVSDLEALSKATPNNWDNVLVDILKDILDIKK